MYPHTLLITASGDASPIAIHGRPSACFAVPINQLDQVLQHFSPHYVLLDSSLAQEPTDALVRRLRHEHPELLVGQITGAKKRAINLADFSIAKEDVARRLLHIPPMLPGRGISDIACDSGSSVWFETGADGKLVSWSAAFAALLGRPPTISELVWPLVRLRPTVERGEQDWLELLRSSKPVTTTGTVCTATRREVPIRLTVGTRRSPLGEVQGLRGHIHPNDHLIAFQPEWLAALWAGTGLPGVLACGTPPKIVSITPEAWRFFSAGADQIGRPLTDLHSWPQIAENNPELTQVPTVEVKWLLHDTPQVTTAYYITWIVGGERWWLIHYPEVTNQEKRRELRVFAETLNITRGDRRLLQILSERLAAILNVACVTVVEFHPHDRSLARMVAAHGMALGANEPWQPIIDLPYARVQQRKFICVARDLRREFPQSAIVSDHHFESFMGAVLRTESGDEIGVLCVFHTEPLQHVKIKTAIIMLHAMRSAAELSYLRTAEMLREQADGLAEMPQLARIASPMQADQALSLRSVDNSPHPAAPPIWLPMDKVSTGLVALDRQCAVVFCNRAANDLLGPDCPERSAALARWSTRPAGDSQAGGRHFDERIGLDRWLHIEVHANNASGPESGGVLIEIRDITQVKSLQRESQLKHILLAGILDSLEDGVITIDRQGNIVSSNRAATEIFDWTTEDLLGHRIDILLAPGEADTHQTAVSEFLHSSALRRRLSERGPILARRRDGSTFPAEIALTKVEIENKTYLSAVISDVSEIEEMRRRQNALTRELQNHERFETLGRLVGGVAHDFNNLIMGISGFTEMAQQDAENPAAVRDGLSHVLQACNRARVLILQMQLAGRSEPAPAALVDIKSVTTEVLRLCGTWKPANCILDLDCTAHQAILVHGHSGQLHEVLLNLIKNGCQALRDQSGKVVVRLAPAAESINSTSLAGEQGMVSIEVEDNGVGIPREDLDHIFEPFFTTKDPEEGTGLGLAVVRRIVENHRGRIGVKSTLGRGTLFRIVLPQAACPFPVAEPVAPASQTNLQGISAWVVEDDQMIRHFLQRGLTALGAEVRTFANAAAALGAAQQSSALPSVVITDRMMAKLDGVEFARRLHVVHPHLPIMLITGWLGQTSSAELQCAGIVSVLPKPFAVEALARELVRCISPDVPRSS